MDRQNVDVVVFGATGFVGRLLCEYLAERQRPDGTPIRWAMAGRSRDKLEAVRTELPRENEDIPILIADADDPVSLRQLCERSRVVVSTVGPYARHGEGIIRACAETGTDYCDLTGEIHWIREMIERYEHTGRETGARLVHCCGFDSIPSDLGVFFTRQQTRKRWGREPAAIHMRVKAMRGGLSGGTAASMLDIIQAARGDRRLRRALADPYLLCPSGHGFTTVRQNDYRHAFFDGPSGRWAAPFVMAGVNTRVVHRSNALGGALPDSSRPVPNLVYDEAVLTGRGWRGALAAWSVSLGLGLFITAAWFRTTRRLLQRFLLPAPGEGPDRERREKGFFDLRFFATDTEGNHLETRVLGQRDPGYGATARMLGEAALCLAEDVGSSVPGGSWTPATALGQPLLERLEAHADLRFEYLESSGPADE